MKAKALLGGLLIASLAIGPGCVSTSMRSDKGPVHSMLAEPVPKLKLDAAVKSSSIDSLINDSDETLAFLRFRDRYDDNIREINHLMEKGSYGDADSVVVTLGNRLSSDKDVFAQRYLVQLKGFSYLLFETKTDVEVVKQHPNYGGMILVSPLTVPATIGAIAILFSVETLLLPVAAMSEEYDCYYYTKKAFTEESTGKGCYLNFETKTLREDIKLRTFDKIKVTPYEGRREVIEVGIPYDTVAKQLNIPIGQQLLRQR